MELSDHLRRCSVLSNIQREARLRWSGFADLLETRVDLTAAQTDAGGFSPSPELSQAQAVLGGRQFVDWDDTELSENEREHLVKTEHLALHHHGDRKMLVPGRNFYYERPTDE